MKYDIIDTKTGEVFLAVTLQISPERNEIIRGLLNKIVNKKQTTRKLPEGRVEYRLRKGNRKTV